MNKMLRFFCIFVAMFGVLGTTAGMPVSIPAAGATSTPLLSLYYSGGLGGNVSSCG